MKSKVTIHTQKKYLDYLIGPSFQGLNRHFIISIEYGQFWTVNTRFSSNYRNLFDKPVKTVKKIFDNIQKFANGERGY